MPKTILGAFEEVDQKSRFDAYYIAKPLKTKDWKYIHIIFIDNIFIYVCINNRSLRQHVCFIFCRYVQNYLQLSFCWFKLRQIHLLIHSSSAKASSSKPNYRKSVDERHRLNHIQIFVYSAWSWGWILLCIPQNVAT